MRDFVQGWVIPLVIGFIAGDFIRLARRYLQLRIDEIESKQMHKKERRQFRDFPGDSEVLAPAVHEP